MYSSTSQHFGLAGPACVISILGCSDVNLLVPAAAPPPTSVIKFSQSQFRLTGEIIPVLCENISPDTCDLVKLVFI